MCHRFELLCKQPLAIKINQARSQPVFTFHPSCHTITFSIFQLLFTGRTASGFKYPILTSLHSNLLELEDLFHVWYSHNNHPVSYVTVSFYYHILFKYSILNIIKLNQLIVFWNSSAHILWIQEKKGYVPIMKPRHYPFTWIKLFIT